MHSHYVKGWVGGLSGCNIDSSVVCVVLTDLGSQILNRCTATGHRGRRLERCAQCGRIGGKKIRVPYGVHGMGKRYRVVNFILLVVSENI